MVQQNNSSNSYNLAGLKKMADNDDEFINQAINIFIKNSEEAASKFRKSLKERDWKEIGETAHRILPSFRHLEVDSVIPDLVEIKTKTLISNDSRGVESLVKSIIVKISNLTALLREETGSNSR